MKSGNMTAVGITGSAYQRKWLKKKIQIFITSTHI